MHTQGPLNYTHANLHRLPHTSINFKTLNLVADIARTVRAALLVLSLGTDATVTAGALRCLLVIVLVLAFGGIADAALALMRCWW